MIIKKIRDIYLEAIKALYKLPMSVIVPAHCPGSRASAAAASFQNAQRAELLPVLSLRYPRCVLPVRFPCSDLTHRPYQSVRC